MLPSFHPPSQQVGNKTWVYSYPSISENASWDPLVFTYFPKKMLSKLFKVISGFWSTGSCISSKVNLMNGQLFTIYPDFWFWPVFSNWKGWSMCDPNQGGPDSFLICSHIYSLPPLLQKAVELMCLVPKRCNDMMNLGRLQGFEVSLCFLFSNASCSFFFSLKKWLRLLGNFKNI